MIRQTLAATQLATFSVELPNPNALGAPTPVGTGFFVSPDGFFVTAAHIVSVPDRVLRENIDQGWLMKESRGEFSLGMCQWPEAVFIDYETDFALLKVDFEKNRKKDWLRDRDGFPFISVSTRELEEGEPVYAFGYPLSFSEVVRDSPEIQMVSSTHGPRVTSAIVASTLERSGVVSSPSDTKRYVLDKALNFGNSGGPIVAVETGHVHAVCSRFQPVKVPQRHLTQAGKPTIYVEIPSLYGIVSSLANPLIIAKLREFGVPLADS